MCLTNPRKDRSIPFPGYTGKELKPKMFTKISAHICAKMNKSRLFLPKVFWKMALLVSKGTLKKWHRVTGRIFLVFPWICAKFWVFLKVFAHIALIFCTFWILDFCHIKLWGQMRQKWVFIPDLTFFPSRIPDPNCLHPGSRIRTVSIPDPGSELSPSRIPDPHKRI